MRRYHPHSPIIGLCGWYRRMREISLFVTLLFSFLHLAYRSPRLADFYDDTIYTLNDAFSRKEVPLWGLDDDFLFSPKMWKFAWRPMATSNGKNLGIFKVRRKMFVPKVGFSGSGNLTSLSKFASDRPLLPWQPTGGFWTQNWLKLG